MADKRCDNGHFIDESWDLCPYCPAGDDEPAPPVVRPARATAAPDPRQPTQTVRPVAAPEPAGPRAGDAARSQSDAARSHSDAAPAPARRDFAVQAPPMERTVAVQKPSLSGVIDAKRYVVGWLVGLNAGARGESYAVRIGRNVLGRDRRSDIVVNDDQASTHHADLVFRPEERRFILMDHNSTNGTYVNEIEIEPRRDLAERDIVRIGSHKFLFMPLCRDGFYWDDEGVLQ